MRDAAVSELLFATGMRISELCSLKNEDINLHDGSILIYGKGDKERRIHIGNDSVSQIMEEYKAAFQAEIKSWLIKSTISSAVLFLKAENTPFQDLCCRSMKRRQSLSKS